MSTGPKILKVARVETHFLRAISSLVKQFLVSLEMHISSVVNELSDDIKTIFFVSKTFGTTRA